MIEFNVYLNEILFIRCIPDKIDIELLNLILMSTNKRLKAFISDVIVRFILALFPHINRNHLTCNIKRGALVGQISKWIFNYYKVVLNIKKNQTKQNIVRSL